MCLCLCLGLGPDLPGQQFRASPVLKSCLLALATHPKGRAEWKDFAIPASRLQCCCPWGGAGQLCTTKSFAKREPCAIRGNSKGLP